MPDPLQVLPYEIWNLCIQFVIDGQHTGPLELTAVSVQWQQTLLQSPSLWSQIYVQNGEDELARISTFLHLSERYSLHVDIMTALPIMDSLRLIAGHISRVSTISIRPGPASDTTIALHTDHWETAASYILATLFEYLMPSDLRFTSCFGISLRENGQLYYHVILMQFTIADTDSQTSNVFMHSSDVRTTLQKYVASTIRVAADLDSLNRLSSVTSITNLASYAQLHDAIRTAIPRLIMLLKEDDRSIRSTVVVALHKLADRVELRQAIGTSIQLLVKLLEDGDWRVQLATIDILYQLAKHSELQPPIGAAVPWLVKLLENGHLEVRLGAVIAIASFTDHAQLWSAIGAAIPALIELLHDDDRRVRLATIDVLCKSAKYADLRHVAEASIPSLIRLLECGDWGIQLCAFRAIGMFADHGESHPESITAEKAVADPRWAIGKAILSLIKRLEDGDWRVRLDTVKAIGKFADHSVLRAIGTALSPLLGLLEDLDSDVRLAAVEAIGKFTHHIELRRAIVVAIPSLIKLLDDRNWRICLGTVKALGKLADHAELHEAIRGAVPWLIKLLEDGGRRVQLAAIDVLYKLANHAVHQAIGVVISPLEEVIGKFADPVELRRAIVLATPSLITVLKDGERRARLATIDVPYKFANHAEFRQPIRTPTPAHAKLLDDSNPRSLSRLQTAPTHAEPSSEHELTTEFSSHVNNLMKASGKLKLVDVSDLTDQVAVLNHTPIFTGSYSFVYLGKLGGKMVAVKVLRWLTGKDKIESMQRKVSRERSVWATLVHPNIAPLYGFAFGVPDLGDIYNLGALISPWYPAGDAEAFLKEHGPSMSFTSRIRLWQGVVEGVNYLHTRSPALVHGDLKPGNILIDNYGNARICDFGLVGIMLDESIDGSGMTSPSYHTGTERYLAFELVTVDGALPTEASDIHASGCLGLEFIFNRKPHKAHKNNLQGRVIRDISKGIPPATRTNNLGPYETGVWDLLEPCWALNPDERPCALNLSTQTATLLSRTRGKRFIDTEHWMCQYTVSKEWLNPPTPDYEG